MFYSLETANATILLSEDWELVTNLASSNWDSHGYAATLNITAGNPGKCLDFKDAPIGDPVIMTHKTFRSTYSAGLSISSDIWIISGNQHFSDIYFGLYNANSNNYDERFVEFNFNRYNKKATALLVSDDANYNDSYAEFNAFNGGVWNTVEIVIRPDQRVEFFINDLLFWTSTKIIDPQFDGNAGFSYRGHAYNAGAGAGAYVDNLLIVPEPVTLLLLGLGGLLIRKRVY